jgi:hypothetical protein
MPILEEGGPDGMLFLQLGVHPHFHKELRGCLKHKFPKKRTGRGKPITWPCYSPHLTPLNFFFGSTSSMLRTCRH